MMTSGSGLDPRIHNDLPRRFRLSEFDRRIAHNPAILENSENRQWGFLGEPRVNVLELNIALDARYGRRR
jgi:potassium-transporting ATPase KdpC subunit